MKNQLIPIQPCSTSGEWEPSMVNHNSPNPKLVNTDGGLRIRTGRKVPTFDSCTFRTDLGGLVHEGGYLPVIQSEEVGIFLVKNPTNEVVQAFIKAKNVGKTL